MFHLAKLRFTELEGLVRSQRTLAILPVGAVEEHGVHLPLGLDTFAAEAYAEAAASLLEESGYTVIMAPPIGYGVARQALNFPRDAHSGVRYATVAGHRRRPLTLPTWHPAAGDSQRP